MGSGHDGRIHGSGQVDDKYRRERTGGWGG